MKPSKSTQRSEPFGSVNKGKVVDIGMTLSQTHINQLSCVEAVVQAHVFTISEDHKENFDNIQHDIKQKKINNHIVLELVWAIDEDMTNIKDFDFSEWVSTRPTCRTFDVCIKEFELSVS